MIYKLQIGETVIIGRFLFKKRISHTLLHLFSLFLYFFLLSVGMYSDMINKRTNIIIPIILFILKQEISHIIRKKITLFLSGDENIEIEEENDRNNGIEELSIIGLIAKFLLCF